MRIRTQDRCEIWNCLAAATLLGMFDRGSRRNTMRKIGIIATAAALALGSVAATTSAEARAAGAEGSFQLRVGRFRRTSSACRTWP